MIDWLINSWTMGAVAAIGMICVGRKKTWGWLVLITCQIMWITYGAVTREFGFVAWALWFGVLNVYNFITWRRDDAAKKEPVNA